MSDAAQKFSPMSFFLHLVGKAPEQLKARLEFEESLKKVEEQTDVLDDILEDIDKINVAAKQTVKKNIDMKKTLHRISSPAPEPE